MDIQDKFGGFEVVVVVVEVVVVWMVCIERERGHGRKEKRVNKTKLIKWTVQELDADLDFY